MNIDIFAELKELRYKLNHGQNATQYELDTLRDRFLKDKDTLRPHEREEVFRLVDASGKDKCLTAPRWQCHLLGLRHRSVHILLEWSSPQLGNVYLLQVRSWKKPDSPGLVDISVGGHVVVSTDADPGLGAAYRELQEELGLSQDDLQERILAFRGGYDSYDQDETNNFYNAEWRDVYVGTIDTACFNRIRFADGEVSGLYLCPSSDAFNFLTQQTIPLGDALKSSLMLCIKSSDS